MTNEIIELLPSIELKNKIKETNYKFSEDNLLQIIYTYAKSFDDRISLLERFSKIANEETSKLAKMYIDFELQNLRNFTAPSDGFVYELLIKDKPDAYEERYLCSSYNAALNYIDRFYEQYASINAKETEESRYRIIKRKVFSENDSFEEDEYFECELGPNKTLLKVIDSHFSPHCPEDIESCSDCKALCHNRGDQIKYPNFIPNKSILKYRDHNGINCFGININWVPTSETVDDFYVIKLNSGPMLEKDYEEAQFCHVHIPAPLANLADVSDLDDKTRERYYEFIEFLEKETN